jgi:RND family efflux transporter MFP subunit
MNYFLTGFIAARVQTDVAFRTSGRIISRRVEVGDHITAEEVLAELDPKDQETIVANAEAALASAQALQKQAEANFARQDALMKGGFATRPAFDQTQEALRTSQASVNAAEAALGSAREQASYTALKAGVDGIIVGRSAEVGQVALAGQTIFTIAQDGARDAVFDVQESLLSRPPASPDIAIALLSNPLVVTTGKVREVAPSVDPTSGTVRVKVALASNPPEMTLGSSVVGAAPSQVLRAFVLPAGALYEWRGDPAVWIVDPVKKSVSIAPVVVQAYVTDSVILSDGVKPGDLVVTAGIQSLRPDETVEIVGPTQ